MVFSLKIVDFTKLFTKLKYYVNISIVATNGAIGLHSTSGRYVHCGCRMHCIAHTRTENSSQANPVKLFPLFYDFRCVKLACLLQIEKHSLIINWPSLPLKKGKIICKKRKKALQDRLQIRPSLHLSTHLRLKHTYHLIVVSPLRSALSSNSSLFKLGNELLFSPSLQSTGSPLSYSFSLKWAEPSPTVEILFMKKNTILFKGFLHLINKGNFSTSKKAKLKLIQEKT